MSDLVNQVRDCTHREIIKVRWVLRFHLVLVCLSSLIMLTGFLLLIISDLILLPIALAVIGIFGFSFQVGDCAVAVFRIENLKNVVRSFSESSDI